MTNVKSSSDTGWWLVVEKLKDPRSSEETLELLEAAVSAAEGDAAWSHSGIMELLRRAKEQARSGHAALATRSAIGLLGFHQTALKLKSSSNNATSDAIGKKRARGESSPTTSSEDEILAGPNSSASDDTETFAHPSAPTSKRPCLKREPTVTWMGSIRIPTQSSLDLEFCKIAIQVPSSLISELPKDHLKVLSISSRKQIMSQGHIACATRVTAAHPQHLTYLRKMAEQELAAVMQIQDCLAVLVPYVSGSEVVKAVTFLMAPALI